ncbi:MAG: substrate-binding domain-containing protein [Victivallales bacterium]|nr:substrate-binding domain-containing protein [Victivallales bacterium]
MPDPKLQTQQPWSQRWLPNNEWVLVFILAFEVVAFSITGDNFATTGNVFEITRLAVSYGLLAFSMTFVIKTGGIDLSVGSIVAIVAVITGVCWQQLGVNIWLASAIGIAAGTLCGGLNGLIVTRLGIPPLIVTLGTMSLFRGTADAITKGYTTYTGFDPAFLRLGQGYLWGVIPTQLPIFILVFLLLWTLMHRMRFGRHVAAIGFGEPGARYAGIPTRRVLLRVYMISGLMAGLAAIVFMAKNGQAKSDAGMGYEMMAIAMCVLGGTAITGGRGTLHGTLLGLFVIVVLQNGLRLSGQTTDTANMLTGVILIGAILVDRFSRKQMDHNKQEPTGKELDMKNNQLILLCASIILAACVVALSNRQLAKAIQGMGMAPATTCDGTAAGDGSIQEPLRIALLPKTKTDPYFVSCKEGADAAAKELGVEFLWDGPTKGDPEKQNEIVEAWITKGVDVICASVLNRDAIDGVLKKARSKGIKVLTWDADANEDARDLFINQATSEGIGNTLADELAALCSESGPYVIISAGTTDANQNEWIVFIKARMADKYPKMDLLEIRYSEGERDKAMTETRNMLNKYPKLKGIMAIAAPAVPGAAEGLKQAGRSDIKLTGLSVPSLCKDYVHADFIDSIILWNTVDLGYLTVHAAKAAHEGKLSNKAATLDFGRLKGIAVGDGNVYLGKPFIFRKDNIDNFDF